ncbi:MAG: rhomboid family intramembrane serine protease [Verrucomicrobiales bacterium]|jgi:membrane associated rhomboid family serine protease|nr:rhomboid family intramembrane serine protease [Verrucomicrobiales bacterium]|tara:strand:- start:1190 stop:1792 length:603 start_codon:yes stop_codon:yes gene_type:complete
MGKIKRSPFFDNSLLLFSIVIIFWIITTIDQNVPEWNFTLNYGIKARDLDGILGIFIAPFLHVNYQHLIGNTLPFLALGGLVLLSGRGRFIFTSILSTIISGLGIWIFAKEGTVHVGSSILIFSYLGFLLMQAWYTRSIKWCLVALVASIFYGALILTLLYQKNGISWHGHFFGFITGIISAILVTPTPAKKKRKAIIKV